MPLRRRLRLSLPAACAALTVAVAGCASEDSAGDDAEVTTPEGYERIESGPLTYAVPNDWEPDDSVEEGWTSHIGAHESAPDVAAAGLEDYQDLPGELTPQEAATHIQEEFPSSNDGDIAVQDAGPADIPGAEDAYRIDYRHAYTSPEFDTHNVADFGIRTDDDGVVAVRVSAVTEMVEDDTFDQLVGTIQVTPD